MSDRLFPILPMGGDLRLGEVRGQRGKMALLPIHALRVNVTFQRAISAGSARNVQKICAQFDWAKFLPVIVVRDGEYFSIVDGQHRTTAAATLGIEEVPCYVLQCSREDAAAAFAAINGNVTAVSPVDIWFAEVLAQVPEAVALDRILQAAGVRITRKKGGYVVGETRAINVLKRAFHIYGDAVLTTVLQCITETGTGNPGMIFGATVNGIAKAVVTKPHLLAEPSRLFDIFDGIDLAQMFEAARAESARTRNPVQFILTREINAAIASHREVAA